MSKSYEFERLIPNQKNFINECIDFMMTRTDASHDFFEGAALLMLAVASTGLRIPGSMMRLNLYMVLCGGSMKSRKSTVLNIVKKIIRKAIPECEAAHEFTGTALLEEMENRPGLPTLLMMDEVSELFEGIKNTTYMAKVRQYLLDFYANGVRTYKRASIRSGKSVHENKIEISNGYLDLLGCVTPSIAERLERADIQDGLIGRLMICKPNERPPQGRRATSSGQEGFDYLARRLLKMFQVCQALQENAGDDFLGDNIVISEEAWDLHRDFEEYLEAIENISENQMILIKRYADHCLKCAPLISLGEADLKEVKRNGHLSVNAGHMKSAISIMKKYVGWAIEFSNGIGSNDVERDVESIMQKLRRGPDGMAFRSDISRNCNLNAQRMRDAEFTMRQRGLIDVTKVVRENGKGKSSQRPTHVWKLVNYDDLVNDERRILEKLMAKKAPAEGLDPEDAGQ